jgi:RNA polymerase sigma factor (sigma-70 family)
MYSRQKIIDIFSTFIQFEADRFSKWMVEPRLHRNMQRHLLQMSKDGAAPTLVTLKLESFWALYWYKRWQAQTSVFPNSHLSAYLQEPCYWAAQQAVKKFATSHYTLPDYFQIAIAEVNTLLKTFNPDKGASLKTYAALAFPSLLRDMLRQRHEIDICTNWTLLRKVSKKRMGEALQQAGLSSNTMSHYRLAWMCFKAVYVPIEPEGKLPKLDQSLWGAIATLYNTERKTQLAGSSVDCSPATLEHWLNQCATWIRTYLYPPVTSLNAPIVGHDVDEVQDQVPDPSEQSLLDEAIAQEDSQTRQNQQTQVNAVLKTAIEQLEPESQTLLRLYYHDGLSQQQIAQQVQMTQVTVSRRLTRSRESLLSTLVRWSQAELNSSPDSNLIKDMSMALEEWLKTRRFGA